MGYHFDPAPTRMPLWPEGGAYLEGYVLEQVEDPLARQGFYDPENGVFQDFPPLARTRRGGPGGDSSAWC
eukprot:649792-Rhodomonas_salina.3